MFLNKVLTKFKNFIQLDNNLDKRLKSLSKQFRIQFSIANNMHSNKPEISIILSNISESANQALKNKDIKSLEDCLASIKEWIW